VLIRIICFCN